MSEPDTIANVLKEPKLAQGQASWHLDFVQLCHPELDYLTSAQRYTYFSCYLRLLYYSETHPWFNRSNKIFKNMTKIFMELAKSLDSSESYQKAIEGVSGMLKANDRNMIEQKLTREQKNHIHLILYLCTQVFNIGHKTLVPDSTGHMAVVIL